MNKIFITAVGVCFILLLSTCPTLARDLPVNERIMYGEVERTAPLMKASEVFFQRVDETGVTREAASEQFAKLGWEYLGQGKVADAVKRFNQAWLLNTDNYLVYWAFGIVAYDRDNHVALSTDMFKKALALKRTSAILADYGRVCEMAGQPEKAIRLFKEGLALNPLEKRCYVGLMRAYDASEDWAMIRHWLEKGEKHEVFSKEEIRKYDIWITESEKIK